MFSLTLKSELHKIENINASSVYRKGKGEFGKE